MKEREEVIIARLAAGNNKSLDFLKRFISGQVYFLNYSFVKMNLDIECNLKAVFLFTVIDISRAGSIKLTSHKLNKLTGKNRAQPEFLAPLRAHSLIGNIIAKQLFYFCFCINASGICYCKLKSYNIVDCRF